ncbi:hypothetical protein [Sphingobium yanoikuyae]|uniref:hypothetical protein n=1 Tax=Sphingobium yanoikuyae TaxID=13690 RepID=UPI000262C7EC|nr:hypothetical protein [Sphingobium yanoikuyae]
MTKALKVAAFAVAIAAAIPTGGGSTLLAGALGVSAATASAFATAVALEASIVGAMTAKKPSVGGVQTTWTTDPGAPIPILFGHTLGSGDIRYRKQHGRDNAYDTIVSVLSGCGPLHAITQTYMDKKPISFSGGIFGAYAIGGANRIWQDVQYGACPEAMALSNGVGTPPGWGATSKLSGYAAVMNSLLFDGKGDETLTSTPQLNWLVDGVLCYDPRQDSTYPGGDGPCRANDQTTWVYSENGWIQALTFALGWHQGPNNMRVGGVGLSIDAIDVATYVENANIADANGWKSGGRVTTADDKWEVMKALTQAGGGEPIRHGAILSGFVNTPRVPIATIYEDDLIGEGSSSTCQTMRDRPNGITPKYTSEDHFWEQVPAGTVQNAAYLAKDGRERTKAVTYPMVQCRAGETPDQAAQLAAYDIANAREASPIALPLKLRWIGFLPGDCLHIDEGAKSFGWIAGKDVVIIKRSFDPTTAAVTLTLRTEDPDKHPWALSQVGVPAPSTDSATTPTMDTPDAASWAAAAGTGDVPSIVITGSCESPSATSIDFAYRPTGATAWADQFTAGADSTGKEFTGLASGASYEVGIRYRSTWRASDWLILAPVTVGTLTAASAETADTATNAGNADQLGGTYTAADIANIIARLDAADIP